MNPSTNAEPFLKWAGGKRQLLDQLSTHFPPGLESGQITRYAEPFVGGGALLFHLLDRYTFDQVLIADVNRELILAYRTVRRAVDPVIERLSGLESQYLALDTEDRKAFYYEQRDRFNERLPEIDFTHFQRAWIERTATLIFLNRTCFNGLFRVNSKGEFNVPAGRYKNPTICDDENLQRVSKALQNADIRQGDFTICRDFVDAQTFVYFDPPYRPISETSSFTSYAKGDFDDADQLRLADFFQELDRIGARLMLSNSDPKNVDPEDDFFEEAFAGYHIERVTANRMINSKAGGRGAITELLITNYEM